MDPSYRATVTVQKLEHFSWSILKLNVGNQGWISQIACQNSK